MLLKAILIPLLLAAAVLLPVWLGQRRLMYANTDQRVAPVQRVLPGAREVTLETEDGLSLAGWWLPAPGAGGVSVLVCNGNAGNREQRASLAAALNRHGFNVLLFDYRGYGGNPGAPTEKGLRRDVRAARGWIESRNDVDPEAVVLFGESMGAAAALAEAVERPPAALVLRSPFLSGVKIAGHHFRYLPVSLLLRDRWRSDLRIRRLQGPLLVAAGSADLVVPREQSRALFEAADLADKRWLQFDGLDHNAALFTGEGEFADAVAAFLRQHVSGRPPGVDGKRAGQ